MQRALLYLTLCFLVSCGQKSKITDSVYFAGEVVNPTSDHVVLYKDEVVVDSAKLDKENRFVFNLPKVGEGLYSFYHSPQYQYVYLEKGDSLILRVNAVAFDESLIFSGTNEDVNNFLLETFLNYEDEDQLVFSYYELNPDDFENKIDSLREQKIQELKDLNEHGNISEKAFKMAQASIDYNSFIYKEKYPFIHKSKAGEDTIHKLGDDFYDYRKKLNINEGSLTYFRPYYNYVNNRFGNISYMQCVQNCGLEKMMTTKGRLHLNEHKIQVIDSLVTEKDLRNNLLRRVTMNYLLEEHELNADCDEFISLFDKLSTNQEHITEINKIYGNIKKLQPKEEIPNLYVFNINGDSLSLKDISRGKKTLFYYWRGSQNRHFRNVLRQVNELKTENPEYSFVGINLKTSDELWHKMLKEHVVGDADISNQFRADDFQKIQEALVLQNVTKCLVTKDTLIVDAFDSVFTPNLLSD